MSATRRFARHFAAHWTWLKWLLAAAIFAWLFHRNREGLARLDWRRVEWPLLAAAFAASAGVLLVTFYRWQLLVRALDLPFRFGDAVRLGMIGNLFNYVAPGAVGGDLIKASLIAREQPGRRVAAAATVLLDRAVGMLGLVLVGSLAVLLPSPLRDEPAFAVIRWAFWLASAGGVLGLAAALQPAVTRLGVVRRLTHLRLVGPVVAELLTAVRLYQSRRGVLVLSTALSCLSHLGILAAFYLCAVAVPVAAGVPTFVTHTQFIPAAELFGVLVPVPAGMGALEGAVAYFYDLAGSDADTGFLAAVAYRAELIALAFLGAGFYLARRGDVRRAVDEAAHTSKGGHEAGLSNGTREAELVPRNAASPHEQFRAGSSALTDRA